MQREERRTHSICTTESRHTHTRILLHSQHTRAHTNYAEQRKHTHTHTLTQTKCMSLARQIANTHTHTLAAQRTKSRLYLLRRRRTTDDWCRRYGRTCRAVLCCLGSAAAGWCLRELRRELACSAGYLAAIYKTHTHTLTPIHSRTLLTLCQQHPPTHTHTHIGRQSCKAASQPLPAVCDTHTKCARSMCKTMRDTPISKQQHTRHMSAFTENNINKKLKLEKASSSATYTLRYVYTYEYVIYNIYPNCINTHSMHTHAECFDSLSWCVVCVCCWLDERGIQ